MKNYYLLPFVLILLVSNSFGQKLLDSTVTYQLNTWGTDSFALEKSIFEFNKDSLLVKQEDYSLNSNAQMKLRARINFSYDDQHRLQVRKHERDTGAWHVYSLDSFTHSPDTFNKTVRYRWSETEGLFKQQEKISRSFPSQNLSTEENYKYSIFNKKFELDYIDSLWTYQNADTTETIYKRYRHFQGDTIRILNELEKRAPIPGSIYQYIEIYRWSDSSNSYSLLRYKQEYDSIQNAIRQNEFYYFQSEELYSRYISLLQLDNVDGAVDSSYQYAILDGDTTLSTKSIFNRSNDSIVRTDYSYNVGLDSVLPSELIIAVDSQRGKYRHIDTFAFQYNRFVEEWLPMQSSGIILDSAEQKHSVIRYVYDGIVDSFNRDLITHYFYKKVFTRVENREAQGIEVYPNPCSGRFFYELPENVNRARLYNQQGQLMQEIQGNKGAIEVLRPGMYFLKMQGRSKAKKIWIY